VGASYQIEQAKIHTEARKFNNLAEQNLTPGVNFPPQLEQNFAPAEAGAALDTVAGAGVGLGNGAGFGAEEL